MNEIIKGPNGCLPLANEVRISSRVRAHALMTSCRATIAGIRFRRVQQNVHGVSSRVLVKPWPQATAPPPLVVQLRTPNRLRRIRLVHGQLRTLRLSLVQISIRINRDSNDPRNHSNHVINTSSTTHMWQTPNLIIVPSLIRIMRTFRRAHSLRRKLRHDRATQTFHRRLLAQDRPLFPERKGLHNAQPRHRPRYPR